MSMVKLYHHNCMFVLLFKIGGLHKCHKRSVNSQIFHKLPGRLGFSLRSLVDEAVLHDG